MPMTRTVIGCFFPSAAADEEASGAAEEVDAAGAFGSAAGVCGVSLDCSAMIEDRREEVHGTVEEGLSRDVVSGCFVRKCYRPPPSVGAHGTHTWRRWLTKNQRLGHLEQSDGIKNRVANMTVQDGIKNSKSSLEREKSRKVERK